MENLRGNTLPAFQGDHNMFCCCVSGFSLSCFNVAMCDLHLTGVGWSHDPPTVGREGVCESVGAQHAQQQQLPNVAEVTPISCSRGLLVKSYWMHGGAMIAPSQSYTQQNTSCFMYDIRIKYQHNTFETTFSCATSCSYLQHSFITIATHGSWRAHLAWGGVPRP